QATTAAVLRSGYLAHKAEPDGGWSGWQRFLKPDDKLVTLAVGQNQDGRLEVFGAASDNSLWHNWQTAPRNDWTGGQPFPKPDDKLWTLAVAYTPLFRSQATAAAVLRCGYLAHKAEPGGGWSGWQRFLKPDDKLVTLAVGQNQDGRLEVFGAASDNSLWHNW